MEPPQVAAILIFILAVIELLIIASYEATFAVTSRSSLEKLRESGVSRAHLMLRVYESRHRLRLMSRAGEGIGVIAIALTSVYLLQPHFHSFVTMIRFSFTRPWNRQRELSLPSLIEQHNALSSWQRGILSATFLTPSWICAV